MTAAALVIATNQATENGKAKGRAAQNASRSRDTNQTKALRLVYRCVRSETLQAFRSPKIPAGLRSGHSIMAQPTMLSPNTDIPDWRGYILERYILFAVLAVRAFQLLDQDMSIIDACDCRLLFGTLSLPLVMK